jgi:hypothetical protein
MCPVFRRWPVPATRKMRLSRARNRAVMQGRGVGIVEEGGARMFMGKEGVKITIASRDRACVGRCLHESLGSVGKRGTTGAPTVRP